MSETVYRVRPGTTDKGRAYENMFIANLVLELILDSDVEDFRIYSNIDKFGAFDDVVMEITMSNGEKQFQVIQLKHGDRLLKTEHLIRTKDFGLIKYFHSFLELEKSASNFDTKKCKKILFTNRKYQMVHDTRFTLDGENFSVNITSCESDSVLRKCFDNGLSFSLKPDEEASEDFQRFFENLFLYTDQLNADQMQKNLSKRFQEEFQCETNIVSEFINFIDEWNNKSGKRKKLTKSWMTDLIAVLLLTAFVQEYTSSLSLLINKDKLNLFRRIINKFDVTFFEECHYKKIKTLWCISDYETVEIKKKEANYYNVNITRNKAEEAKRNSIMLWLLNKCPLIVRYTENVMKTISKVCKNKKFIIIYSEDIKLEELETLNSFSLFRTLTDLKEKTSLYKEFINTFYCSLQGKPKITLEKFIRQTPELETCITTNQLILSLHDSFMVGEKEARVELYIDRSFSRHILDLEFLRNSHEDTLILISNFDRTYNNLMKEFEVIGLGTTLRQNHNTNEKMHRKIIYVSENEISQEHFKILCTKLGNYEKCHLFRIFEGKLEWIRSLGEVTDLNEFLIEGYSVEEEEFYGREENITVICGNPGIGKSFATKKMKNTAFPSMWTILMNPKDHSKYFFENRSDINQLENYLMDEAKKTKIKEFDIKVFDIMLRNNRVNYIWDALDEVYSTSVPVVIEVIKDLSKKDVKQCITSRNNLKDYLENELSVLSSTLKEFDEEQQMEYLRKRLKYTNSELQVLFTKISNHLELFKYNEILSIPLQIYMFTELYIRDKNKYNSLLNNSFSLTDLYEHFVSLKFIIYFEGKERVNHLYHRSQQYKKDQIEKYELAAYEMFFCDNKTFSRRFLNDIKINGDPVGIIASVSLDQNIPNFLHNSYGEYFAALYLARNYKNIPNLSDLLFEADFTNIRYLFDMILAKNHPAHIAVLCKNFEVLQACDDEALAAKDEGGRSPLHLASSWGVRAEPLEVARFESVEGSSNKENKLSRSWKVFRGTVSEFLHLTRRSYWVRDYLEEHYKSSEVHLQKDMLEYLMNYCTSADKDEVFKCNALTYAKNSLNVGATLTFLINFPDMFKKDLKIVEKVVQLVYYSVRFEFPQIFDVIQEIPIIHTYHGNSLLGVAAVHGSSLSCGKLLSIGSYQSFVNKTNNYGQTPLHIVSHKGYANMVKLLSEYKADVNIADTYNQTPLFEASWRGHTDVVKILTDHQADVNVTDSFGQTPLFVASERGYIDIIKLLFKHKPNVNIANEKDYTPMYIASEKGHVDVVKLLIENNADISLANKHGENPLHVASERGFADVVKLLIESETEINIKDKYGYTPLHIASEKGYVEVVKLLTEHKANVNVTSRNGRTSLHIASERGHVEVVKLLIEFEAEVDAVNLDGYTPLHIACERGHADVMKVLIQSGADTDVIKEHVFTAEDGYLLPTENIYANNLRVVDGQTLLTIACWNENVDVVRLLLTEYKADVNMANEYNEFPLKIACSVGNTTIVQMLLQERADVKILNPYGECLMIPTKYRGFVDVAKLLIEHKTDVNMADKYGYTPLHIASEKGYVEVVKLLTEYEADINVMSRNGRTSLHIASERGHVEVVKLLIEHEAEVDAIDVDGYTPLCIAREAGHFDEFDVVNVLINSGADTDIKKYENVYQNATELWPTEGANANNFRVTDGQTSLTTACWNGDVDMVRLLTENGADINMADKNGEIPLSIACYMGNVAIVQLLLAHNAHVNVVDKNQQTPLHIAHIKGFTDLVAILAQNGATF